MDTSTTMAVPAVAGAVPAVAVAVPSTEAARITGLSYRMLDYYVKIGVVECETPAGGWGPGHARAFTIDQLYGVMLVGRLRELGLTSDVCRDARRALDGVMRRDVDRADATLVLWRSATRWRAVVTANLADVVHAALGLRRHLSCVMPLGPVFDAVDEAMLPTLLA